MTEAATRNLLTPLDAGAVLLYLVAVLWIGLRYSRQEGADSYFLGHKKIPGWAVGISMFASILSSFTFIAFPGWAFDGNWAILLREFQMFTVLMVCGFWIIPIYRRVIRMSVYEYLEKRVGAFARLYISAGTIILTPLGNGVLLYVVSLALHSMTGWDMRAIILTLGLITFVYAFLGGIEAVVWTEVLQGLLFMGAGLVTVLFLIFWASPDSAGSLLGVAWEGGKFNLGSWEPSLSKETAWVFIVAGLVSAFAKFSRDPSMVQRYLLASDSKAAFRAALISTLCCVLTWTLFTMIGSLLWAYYQTYPDRMPTVALKGDEVFPYFMASAMPKGVTGFILAGLCASAMSGLAAALNTIGAVAVSDFYLRFARHPSERRQLLISRSVVTALAFLSLLCAWALTFWEGGIMRFVLNVLTQVAALVVGGATGMFLLGLMTRRASPRGIYIGLVVGMLFTTWAILTGNPAISDWMAAHVMLWDYMPRYSMHIWLVAFWADVVAFIFGFGASVLLDRGYRAPRELTVWALREGQEEVPCKN
jgi:SSS family solute:Na+ symporter